MAGAKRLSDGKVKLLWVPNIANHHAPTLAELSTSGTAIDLTELVSINNFEFGATDSDTIDDPALSARSNSTGPGRSNYSAAMDFFRYVDVDDDIAWDAFTQKGQHGYLVCRRGKEWDAALVATDEVGVMEVLTDEPQPMNPAANTYEKFRMRFFPQDRIDMRAAVAA